jgi:hypothetical protein
MMIFCMMCSFGMSSMLCSSLLCMCSLFGHIACKTICEEETSACFK